MDLRVKRLLASLGFVECEGLLFYLLLLYLFRGLLIIADKRE